MRRIGNEFWETHRKHVLLVALCVGMLLCTAL